MIRILEGDCRSILATLPAGSVHCCVTSPPYFGLRDYGTGTWIGGSPVCAHVVGEMRRGLGLAESVAITRGGGHKAAEVSDIQARALCPSCGARRVDSQIGLEATPEEFVLELVQVFREVRRVLRDDGTLWLNLGDSYATSGGTGAQGENSQRVGRSHTADGTLKKPNASGIKAKDLLGIPWLVAFALRADGWYLRQDIIWSKPNPMPESVQDRCTKAHEYLFLLSKSPTYFCDMEAIREDAVFGRRTNPNAAPMAGRIAQSSAMWRNTGDRETAVERGQDQTGASYDPDAGRNKRSVWTVSTQPFKEAHFATFPPDLIEPCIKAGCPATCCSVCGAPRQSLYSRGVEAKQVEGSEVDRFGDGSFGTHRKVGGQYQKWLDENPKRQTGVSATCECNAPDKPGTVLDPFGGAGTTGLVADRHQRDAILIELNPAYAAMARERLVGDAPLFADVA